MRGNLLTGGGDKLAIEGVSKRSGVAAVLETMSINVANGEFGSLPGPSDCGTATRLID